MPSSKTNDNDEATIDLVRRLSKQGKIFSISIEHADAAIVEKARKIAGEIRLVDTDDANCTQWVYVPELGRICVKHG